MILSQSDDAGGILKVRWWVD